ncbi:MAG: SAP domain-containing protein [Candidatus Colwellbacteria bacterium]|nr:SAP domain-containing protein [Candidatus Colwellbacteria bacterium]
MPITKSKFDSKDCSSYSKDDLVEFAKKLKLPYSGTKDKICERINDHLGSESSSTKKKTSTKKKSEKKDDFDVMSCSSYTAVQLKEYCKKYGLRVSGTKGELCDRLRDKFSCDLPKKKKDDPSFDPKKCDGDKPSYSKYELEKFADKNKVTVKKSDTKRDICDKLTSKASCKELEVVEVGKALKKKKPIIEIETDSEEEEKPRKRATKKKIIKDDTTDEEEERPKTPPKRKPAAKKPVKKVEIEIETTTDEEEERPKTPPKRKPAAKKPVKKVEIEIETTTDEEEERPKRKPAPKKPAKKGEDDEFDEKKCGDKPRYLKAKIISFAEKYNLNTSGTAKDICVRIKDHLSERGEEVPEIVEDVLEEEEKPKKRYTEKNLKQEIFDDVKNGENILRDHPELIDREDFANFKKLEKDKILFLNMFSGLKGSFHTLLEYFIAERPYRRFFSTYMVRIGKKKNSPKEIIDEFGHLLGGKLLAKFKVLSDKKKLSIAEEYIKSTKPLIHFFGVDECRDDNYKHCAENGEVCDIDLGQCVKEDDLALRADGIEIDGKRIIGSISSIKALRKKLKIKTKEEAEEERIEAEKMEEKMRKNAEKERKKKEKEAEEEAEKSRKKTDKDRRKKEEADRIAAEHAEEKERAAKKERAKERERDEAKKERERAESAAKKERESGYADGPLPPASPRVKPKPSSKPVKPVSPEDVIDELDEGDEIIEEESDAALPSGGVALDKLKDLFGSVDREGKLFKKKKKDEEESDEEDEERIEHKRRKKEKKERKRREAEERDAIAEKEATDAYAAVLKKREVEKESRLEKERAAERKEEEESERKAEEDAKKKEMESKLKPLGRDKDEERRLADESRRKIKDELAKRDDEEVLEDLPSKESLLSLAKELAKPQKEIARCLGLLP